MANARTLRKSYLAKYWLIWPSSSLLCVLAPCSGVLFPTDLFGVTLLTNSLSGPDWPLRVLTPNWVKLSIVLFWSRWLFGYCSLFDLRTKLDKGVLQDTHAQVKDAEDKVTSLATHQRTHTSLSLSLYIYIYIYIYIYCHPQTVSFWHHFSVSLDTQDAWSQDRNPSNFTLDLVSDHSANKRTTLAKGIIRSLCSNGSSNVRLFTFLYPIEYQSAQFFRRALHYANGSRKFPRQSAQPPWGSVYIVIHRHTVSFYQNFSVWQDTQDAWSQDWNPSKFTLNLVSDPSANKRTTLA